MSDIVETLRTVSGHHEWDRGRNEMLDKAADEIEMLRKALRSIAVGKMTASDAAYVARTASQPTFTKEDLDE